MRASSLCLARRARNGGSFAITVGRRLGGPVEHDPERCDRDAGGKALAEDGVLGKGLAAQVADANGSVLVTTGASAPGGSVALADGASFTIGISWSNWCAAAPAAPVTLALKMSGWESFVPVAVPTGETDPVPPCMGSGQPSVLSWTGLEPQQ